jgi:myosin heavy subunit
MKRSMKRVAKDQEKGRKTTVAQDFKMSLAALIAQMNTAEPHFVRCIKPNMEKKPDLFIDDLTTKQLRYTGLVGT